MSGPFTGGNRPTDNGARGGHWVPPMELDPDGGRIVPAEPAPADALPPSAADRLPALLDETRSRWRLGRWVVGSLAAVVGVGLGFDAYDLLFRAAMTSTALWLFVLAMLVLAAGATLGLLVRELVSLRRLRHIERLRGEADRLTATAPHGQAGRFATALTRLYEGRPDLGAPLARLQHVVTDAHDDGEVVRLIDREVLTVLDRRAFQMVLRASRDTAIATALSPAALLDLLVVLWRNLKLVRDVASVYGARPGYVGSLRLLRRMLANLAVAGVTESAHHVAVDALGGSIAAAISTRVGQGVINGLLTARVGLTAMHLCRPVPFGPDTRPSLGKIRAELLSVPKQVL